MFNVNELKKLDNNILYDLLKVLKAHLKLYTIRELTTLAQNTTASINTIKEVLKLRGE